jgi:hypothetical protein
MEIYRCDKVVFMDNVCDTWAEGYADALIERNGRVRAFMELRVHHPESFWAKLALCGVEDVQVGIESFVQELLTLMNKGTRAKDNLLVQKWLKELGIRSSSNLITHHPKSTTGHVRETKAILREIPHLDRLHLSNFALLLGSPIDRELIPEERRRLVERTGIDLPASVRGYFTLKGEYEPPDRMLDDDAMAAWSDLEVWERRFRRELPDEPSMTVSRLGDVALVIDARTHQRKEFFLEGDSARVYELCHRGPTLAKLEKESGLGSASVQRVVTRFLDDGLLIAIGEHLVSLALRPRDELIRNIALAADQRGQRRAETVRAGEDGPLPLLNVIAGHP